MERQTVLRGSGRSRVETSPDLTCPVTRMAEYFVMAAWPPTGSIRDRPYPISIRVHSRPFAVKQNFPMPRLPHSLVPLSLLLLLLSSCSSSTNEVVSSTTYSPNGQP